MFIINVNYFVYICIVFSGFLYSNVNLPGFALRPPSLAVPIKSQRDDMFL